MSTGKNKKGSSGKEPTGNHPPKFQDGSLAETRDLNEMYQTWFLDYASYVILERAVPHINDGLKPVQRRILHSMNEMEDGRYNKVANIIGHSMKYHPHGDASIGDALVQLGQKNLLIDCQGNWGDPSTGDSAAAPRYIEARLSKFARDILFNEETTEWQFSYDGRNNEPITLPVKFPLLLAQGVEGIAVGLATKIMPHNFRELIEGAIQILKGKTVSLVPDFPSGGLADVSQYNEGLRGGKIRIRAKITEKDKKTLLISEIPYGTTTESLIDSIVNANEKGKIKIRKVEDNTGSSVEILVHLAPGISPDITIDALFAFTDCEVSISPNACVVMEEKPRFMPVNEILKHCTLRTKLLLGRELEIKLAGLKEKHLFSSLEKIFIEKRIYRKIEECETWEAVIKAIDLGISPYKKQFYRIIKEEDLVKLTEIRIKRISKFDSFKAEEEIRNTEATIAETENYLANLNDYTINWFSELLKKYGKGRERKTEIRIFDKIAAAQVAIANQKLYLNRTEGFIGTGLKKDEFLCDCSDIDDIIVFLETGTFKVVKVSDKVFIGKGIIHAGIFNKNDDRTVYNLIYSDGPKGPAYMKRFQVLGITREKEYDLTKGTKGSRILYFTANPNGEGEIVTVHLKPNTRLRKLVFDQDLGELGIKGRGVAGNLVSKYEVKKVVLKSRGISTLSGRKIWYDEVLRRLNTDGRGTFLGSFEGGDRILAVYKAGYYELTGFDLTVKFDDGLVHIEKFSPEITCSVIYFEGEKKTWYLKRFLVEEAQEGKKIPFISESPGSKLEFSSLADQKLKVRISFAKEKGVLPPPREFDLTESSEVRGIKALGTRIGSEKISSIEKLAEINSRISMLKHENDTVEPENSTNQQDLKLF